MKKIFEIPEMEVVRFVEADIVVCSDAEWTCQSYTGYDGSDCHPYTGPGPFPEGVCDGGYSCEKDTSCDDEGIGCNCDSFYCTTDS